MAKDKLKKIKMGFVSQPHGIRGEAELRLFNTEDSVLEEGMQVTLIPKSEKSSLSPEGEDWTIAKLRFGNKIICQLEGVQDRTQLEKMIPFEVFLDRDQFPETEDGEVYLVDLIDMMVVGPEGEELGKLESFSDNGVQYLLEVRLLDGSKITLPYVDAFFPEVDTEKGRITMIMPEYSE